MRKNSVAVLDIRSSEITAVVGERGVNNTFIIKSKYSCDYDGYAEGELLDIDSFTEAVRDVVKSTVSALSGIKTFYVGVPGEFIKVINTDKVMSFNSAKKISHNDCAYLAELSAPYESDEYKTIRHSCLYYVLSDKRKIIYPVGETSDSLEGKFCFYQCKNDFIDILLEAFKKFDGISNINLIPMVQAEAIYLLEPEKRDEYAVLVDLGYISSSYSVVCGNGLAFSESFSVGVGHIAVYLMAELEIPFEVALSFMTKINLNSKERLSTLEEVVYEGNVYSFPTVTVRDKIREGLDGICETLEECRQSYTGKNLDGKPIYITGEGVKVVRGTVEHISNRLVKNVEVIAPKVPYYDKPQFSSVLSLLNMALKDAKPASIFNKFKSF
ncbi:MAG: hypothetical protein K2I30_05435 [Clostridia bacterium]|nr:hypothetical protein [Clostridia bacterium]